ncbi:MAG: PIN domain-containing protein [Clostridiales bacterium]|nr:PIN domain-containing protein [Clostridiales bacterium]
MKVLFDTCVLIDSLENRRPFSDFSNELFLKAASGEIDGFITANSVTDIFYIIRKHIGDKNKARSILSQLLSFFSVIDTTESDCRQAVFSEISDYEDAVMVESGIRTLVDYIVTRNSKDFIGSRVEIVSSEELLSLINN